MFFFLCYNNTLIWGIIMRKDPTTLAQLIVRGKHINFGKSTFSEESGLYRFTNEDILFNTENVITHIKSKLISLPSREI